MGQATPAPPRCTADSQQGRLHATDHSCHPAVSPSPSPGTWVQHGFSEPSLSRATQHHICRVGGDLEPAQPDLLAVHMGKRRGRDEPKLTESWAWNPDLLIPSHRAVLSSVSRAGFRAMVLNLSIPHGQLDE